MVNVTCCGNQNRNTEASETHPNRAPSKTMGCYSSDNPFEYDKCGIDDPACRNHGGCTACTPDDMGGYCDHSGKYYVNGSPLNISQMMERRGNSSSDIDTRRVLSDYDRRMTNRIRNLQIMGQDPIRRPPKVGTGESGDSEGSAHSFVTTTLANIGTALLFIMLLISIFFSLVHMRIINIKQWST